jgi:uncharacterized sulfatase
MKIIAIIPILSAILLLRLSAADAKPNIVIYLSDDHSQYDSSLYGDKTIPTPHLEKLAADGIKFTHAFVASPACAPSRAAMLTGLMPARNGAEDNHSYPKPGTRSLILDLKETGYETVAIGKVAHGKSAESFGFDTVIQAGNGGKDPAAMLTAITAHLENRETSRPLCLFIGTSDPHVPWPRNTTFKPNQVSLPPHSIDGPLTRDQRAHYYQGIRNVDDLLGKLRTLTTAKLGENTLFLHTSDHGAQWAFGKWTLYDYGTRVPFVAAWPGKIKPNTTTSAMASWIDIIPTLIEIGGGNAPADIDGQSLLPVLLRKTNIHRDRIFTTHSGDREMNVYPIRAVRTADWKLIHNLRPDLAWTNHSDLLRRPFAGIHMNEWARLAKTDEKAAAIMKRYYQRPEFEFYHVTADPWETQNLIDDPNHADQIAKLKTELTTWRKSQNDSGKLFAKPRPLDQPETWHPNHWEDSGNP